MINIEQYLNNFYKGNRKPSLDTITYFMNKYNNFEKELNFIHISGTNGKGSCTQIMSNILISQGYTVGKFLSPHLIRFNERISINNNDISDNDLSALIEELKPQISEYEAFSNTKVSYFELITIIGLLYFYRNNVDFVVLETGLGGLYDCTNIISHPLVSIITSIGYDHMHILGNSLTEIAFQKAGIIKPNSDSVLFNQSPEINDIFIKKSNLEKNKLHLLMNSDIKNYSFDNNYQYFDFGNYSNLKLNLKGKIQVNNACLCLEACNILKSKGFELTNSNIKKGLSTVKNHARMEVLKSKPLIVFDGAHNEQAMANLYNMIEMYYKNEKKTFVISILNRKDYDRILKQLSRNTNSTFIVTSGNNDSKFASSDTLYNSLSLYTSTENILKNDLNTAISDALNTSDNSITFFVGSFYTYKTVLNKIKNKEQ